MSTNLVALQLTVSASAQQVAANNVVNSVTLYALAGNTGTVYIIVSTNGTANSATSFPLEKGTSVRINISNTNQIWYIGTASDKFGIIGS